MLFDPLPIRLKSNLGGGIFLTFTLWVRPLTALPSTNVLKITSPLLFGVNFASNELNVFLLTADPEI